MVGLWYRRKLRGTRQASNGGRVRVRIIHGLNISHKELTYLLQKSISYRKKKYYMHAPRGDRLVGKDHRSSPTATHKEGNQKSTPCNKFVTQLLPYVHVVGLSYFNTSISQFHNYSTSTTLISPPLYCKTIARNQTYHIQ